MISLGRDICGDLAAATLREWLVTNGIGGFASGTLAGMNTRRYHGLLVAALQPPLGRTLTLAKLDAEIELDGQRFELMTNEWDDGTVSPHGYRLLQSFELQAGVPVFTYALAGALLEKRIWMAQGANTTYVTYRLVRGRRPVRLTLRPIGGYRDYHHLHQGAREKPELHSQPDGVQVLFREEARPYWLRIDRGTFYPDPTWYWGFYYRSEAYRGLETSEDLYSPGRFETELQPGEGLTFVASLDPAATPDGARAVPEALAQSAGLTGQSPWVQELVRAAGQFIVDRPVATLTKSKAGTEDPAPHAASGPGTGEGKTILAGYHWFGDWGRDTMISLPGLTLATGRPQVALTILRTFARHVSQGMLPNRFPDAGQEPEYNTVDATLWYFYAIDQVRAYLARQVHEDAPSEVPTATPARDLVAELYPTLVDVIDWHVRGTRYGIKVDQDDGLLRAGEPNVQLTWMDAKVHDWVVTPRQGKPVEINALWYHALRVMADFARQLDRPDDASRWDEMARRVADSFGARFWYAEGGYLYDVIDGPAGDDPALRPNQLLAVSLPYGLEGLITQARARQVVDTCAAHLLTSYGLRSLSPTDPYYQGRYGGDQWQRDGAYHQGTVWAWLIGPFVEAHYKVYGDAGAAQSFLQPFAHQLMDHGLGSLSEIFDGDPPHTPRGCIAQAWSVAEVLRVWLLVGE